MVEEWSASELAVAPGELLGTAETTVALLPGASTVVELPIDLEGVGPWAIVRINRRGTCFA